MQIFVNTLNGISITLEVQGSDTIHAIKTKIRERVALFHNDKKLDDNQTLKSYKDIKEKSIVDVVLNV